LTRRGDVVGALNAPEIVEREYETKLFISEVQKLELTFIKKAAREMAIPSELR